MTIDECKKYLPNRWAEIIQQDPLLMEIFEEHDYDLEEEAVPVSYTHLTLPTTERV